MAFINESKGPIRGFLWEFGDGTTSPRQHPIRSYAVPGVYTVRLTVIGAKGERQSSELKDAVRVLKPEPPTVDFQMPASVVVNEPTQFFDRSRGLIDQWHWDFGDGSPTVGEHNPCHVHASPGRYLIRLTVRGPGGERKLEKEIKVVSLPGGRPQLWLSQPALRPGMKSSSSTPRLGRGPRAAWTSATAAPPRAYQAIPGRGLPQGRSRTCIREPAATWPRLWRPVPAAVIPRGRTRGGGAQVAHARGPVGGQPKSRPRTAGRAFTNKSKGTIHEYRLDYGDGSPPLAQASLDEVEHTYGPGRFMAVLTALGPEPSAISVAKAMIVIASPWPWWVKKPLVAQCARGRHDRFVVAGHQPGKAPATVCNAEPLDRTRVLPAVEPARCRLDHIIHPGDADTFSFRRRTACRPKPQNPNEPEP